MKQYFAPKFPSQAVNQQTTEMNQLIVGLGFVFGMWGLSRLVVWVAMLVIAPLLPEPAGGTVPSMMSWWTFARWDSLWYYHIVYDGYEYVDDSHEYAVAFFPMYPLLIKGLIVLTGLPFEVVGTLLSNVSFVGALMIAYRWLSTQYDHKLARWTVLLLTWCPLSFFVSVIYTEGLFLFFSTAALASFERNHHLQAGIWGALASATRFQGIMLVPAFVLAAWKDKRPVTAYLGGLMAGLGTAMYSLFCAIKFHEPLAFIKVQQAWRSSLGGLDWQGWLKVLNGGVMGILAADNWLVKGALVVLFCGTWLGIIWLWVARHRLTSTVLSITSFVLLLVLWLQWGNEMVATMLTIGGFCLLWHYRYQLMTSTLLYGVAVISLAIASGSTMSVDRIAYGTVSISIAGAMLCRRYPAVGLATIIYCALALVPFSIRFAQEL